MKSFYFLTLFAFLPLYAEENAAFDKKEDVTLVLAKHVVSDLSTSLLNAKEIESRRTSSATFQELLQTEPGAYQGNPTAGVLSLRGVNQEGLFGGVGSQTQPLITVFENSMPLSTTTLRYLAPPTAGLERFEVRRGVQNFNAGSASIAGSLLMQSTVPDFSLSSKARFEYAEHGTWTAFLSQHLPLKADELALNLSYYHFETEGEVSAPLQNNPDFGAWDRDRIKASLLWHPAKNKEHSLLLTFLHDESDGNPQANTTVVPGLLNPYDRISNTNTPSSYPAQRQALALQTALSLPHHITLHSSTAYQRVELGQHLDFDGNPLLSWTINGQHDERLFTQSVSLSQEVNKLQWETGLFYENSAYEVGYAGIGIAPVPTGSPYDNQATTDVETFAWYGKVSHEVANNLRLTAGLRFQHDSRELNGTAVFGIFPEQSVKQKTNDHAFLPSLKLEWTPNEETNISLSAARGYRAGGVAFAPIVGVGANYDKEKSWDFELAMRHNTANDVTVQAAIFYSKMNDQHVSQTVPNGLPGVDILTANAGKSHRYGGELQVQWQANEDLHFFANTAYLKTEFDELNLNGVDRSGDAFPNAPRWTAACGVDYQHRSGFFSKVHYTWINESHSSAFSSSTKATKLDSRSLLNARIGWKWDKMSCYVFGSNLLDDNYAVFRGEAIPPIIPEAVKIAPSRTVGVGLAMEW